MGFRITSLRPDDPVEAFPDPATMGTALGYPDGLAAIGGDLSVERLLEAYRRGIFPWFNEDQPILWWSPNPRAVIFTDDFHMSHSLARQLRRGGWAYSVNACFDRVIDACAHDRGEHGTWITPAMQTAYNKLHELGYAQSVEAWQDGELAGGIYGIRLGHMYFGESMFSRRTDGSKVALSALIHLAKAQQIRLVDCQVASPHLQTLGTTELPRGEFLRLLGANPMDPAPLSNTGPERLDAAILADLRRPRPR